jgi:hypothetical protein
MRIMFVSKFPVLKDEGDLNMFLADGHRRVINIILFLKQEFGLVSLEQFEGYVNEMKFM